MTTHFADALVLRLTPFREADAVVHLLTREAGTLAVMARGARKSQKRFGGALDYFCLVRAEIRPARQGMGALLGVELLRAFEAVRSDVDRYYAGCHFLEVARRGAREGDPAPELFALLEAGLDALDRGAHRESVVRTFQVRALGCLGYEPALDACSACGAPLAEGARADAGRLACGACARAGAKALSAGTLQTLRAALRLPLERVGTLRFTDAAAAEAAALLDGALAAALGVAPERLAAGPPAIRN
ncbi:MAG: DNA repair protein RecO [Deltaproteobacteria bacterium]|nr:DNA repair protein RecO [Deltaproteobacteria bacterium]